MGNTSKSFTLILILIMIFSSLSLLIVKPVCAQSIPTPSVPQFTIKYMDKSYDVPPTYGIDTYTGKNVIVQAGYHVQNKSLEVTIQNGRFTPYRDSNGTWVTLMYDVRSKGHFGTQWQDTSATHVSASNSELSNNNVLLNPNDPSTTIDIGFMSNNGSGSPYYTGIGDVSAGGQVDIQVQAFIGYYKQIPYQMTGPAAMYNYDIRNGLAFENVFTGEASGWSSTQTFTMPESQGSTAATNSTLSPTPTVPELSWFVIPLFLSVLSATALLIIKKRYTAHG